MLSCFALKVLAGVIVFSKGLNYISEIFIFRELFVCTEIKAIDVCVCVCVCVCVVCDFITALVNFELTMLLIPTCTYMCTNTFTSLVDTKTRKLYIEHEVIMNHSVCGF